MADQELLVKIEGDASGLAKATSSAAKQLDGLQKDVQQLDQETIEVTPEVELARVNRDLANLNKALDGIERRKANPDVGLDTVQLLRDEAKVRKAIDSLDQRRVEIEAGLVVDPATGSGLSLLQSSTEDLTQQLSGRGGLIGTAGMAAGRVAAMGGASATAATGVGAVAVAAGLAAKGAWELGESAADAQTSIVQLDALTKGMGSETFGELQKWAAATPFAIEDAVGATKRLVAAGVPLQQLPVWLEDLGNVAAATGVPLDQIGTVFAQMVSKGKATYEEMQQLAEAGIPVWQVLSDKLGMSTEEVQKLATNGKLGADTIELLRDSLNQLYPDAMAKQAETFNGQMSTLNDNLDQTGQSLGQLFLPAMTDLVAVLNIAAGWALKTAQALNFLNDKITEHTDGWVSMFDLVMPGSTAMLKGLDALAGGEDDNKDATDEWAASTDALVDKVLNGMGQAEMKVEDYEKALKSAADAYAEIGGDVRTKVSFIISSADLKAEIAKAVGEGVTLPADLTIGQIGGLSDAQQELLTNISDTAEQGLQEGARRAQLDPNFDSAAWYAKVRQQTRGLLIDVGIDPTEADRVLDNIIGLPKQTTITAVADVTQAQTDLQAAGAPVTVPLYLQPPQTTLQSILAGSGVDTSQPVTLTPTVAETPKATATAELDKAAEERTARVVPAVDPISLSMAKSQLDGLAEDRYTTIWVTTAKKGGGGGGTGGEGPPLRSGALIPYSTGMLAAAGTLGAQPAGLQFVAAPAGAGAGGTIKVKPAPTQLAPRQTPIKVYLDGAEIADHLELKARRMATSTAVSVKRLA